jgi:uncharacterized membrane protein YraQ (UPF0718 family)
MSQETTEGPEIAATGTLVGIGLGAAIHGFVPQDFMASFMGRNVWWAVPAAVVLGVPMYTNAAGILLVGYVFNLVL